MASKTAKNQIPFKPDISDSLSFLSKTKYISGGVLAAIVGFGLFFIMVLLISLGDSGIKEDKSVKLVDIVMPDRDIDTLLQEVEKPDEPEEQPDDIAQPEVELQPLTGVDVTIAKPKANIQAGGSFFKDGEYMPLFAVQPQYPRRAQERGTEGYAIISFTITEQGTAENPVVVEGKCGDVNDPNVVMRDCSIFNNSSIRASAKLKYKPKIVDGNPVKVDNVLYRFRYEMLDED
ncbi:MAG: TonB family protein [Gammaproteobacteria bacterium]|jgi:protein TonB|uniref:Protein TonB n=1 Tax=SAR86 cluster bacterium TaxID=2030880 RepID=A0A368C5X3_9GAMM|nr:MAG: energy transducer TonB [SAR86 cluster bacterium]|tara:strand:- start:2846 stop:3544 length:699 start_codon:yes stop_codon:yes gene_type:complete